MIVKSINNRPSVVSERVFDPSATRSLAHDVMDRTFDPDSLPEGMLDKRETARIVGDYCRKLRLLAMRSDNPSLLWMLENAFYEAYAVGCSQRRGLDEAARARAPALRAHSFS